MQADRQDAPTATGLDENYDLRGLACPLPVLKTRRRLADMAAGARLCVETTDPLAIIDIPAFCRDAGHRLLATEILPAGYRFLIERAMLDGPGPIPADPSGG